MAIFLRLFACLLFAQSDATRRLRWKAVARETGDVLALDSLTNLSVTSGAPAPLVLTDQFFDSQLLNHSEGAASPFWSQRYHLNAKFSSGPTSPVFVYLSGPSPADASVVTDDNFFMVKLAQQYGALVVSVEQRFYGQSQPMADWSLSSLAYLTVGNTVADIATLQDHIIMIRVLSNVAPWVLFGGGYGGMLATWTKYTYPNRFAGAVASSAPIELRASFPEYVQQVEEAVRVAGGDDCVGALAMGLQEAHALIASHDTDAIHRIFNTCTPLATALDRTVLEMCILQQYQRLAQENDWELLRLSDACGILTAKNGLRQIDKMAVVHARSLNVTGTTCTHTSYTDNWLAPVAMHWPNAVDAVRQWSYQLCTAFGFAQTTGNSIFSALEFVTLDSVYHRFCADAFNITDTEDRIQETRAVFPGIDINVGNVVFVSGALDPWAPLSPRNISALVHSTSAVVVVAGASTGSDVFAANASANAAVAHAHSAIEAAVAKYIS
ncbi:serine protease family S28 [Achlya hypogyna]|uniref:Serine protease family S28 n=1 Tax=Achlya hypogyna TaxID=1202772 RepID=A0A1V9YCC0_ACHHY|nr:serine protease family S28 [Achlya hypogyna]